MASSYKPDIGTVLALNTGAVITGSTTVTVEVKKPSGTTASWPAVVGSDTYSVEHTVTFGDFSEAGTYILQAKIIIGGNTWYGSSVNYIVLEAFT